MKSTPEAAGHKIRVAHIVFSLEPGGLENGVVNLSNALDRERFETLIYCLVTEGEFAERLENDVVVRCIDKSPGFSFRVVWRLIGLIRNDRPNLLHTHNLGPLIYGVLASIGSFRCIPILHGEHGVFQGDDLCAKSIAIRKCLYRFCRRIHTVSGSLRNYITDLGLPSDRLTAVLNGVDCMKFHPPSNRAEAREVIAIPKQAEVIGIVGRLIESKRHIMMLEAFERIAKTRPEAVLLILGDGGDQRAMVEAAIDTHPAREQVRWVGHQADPAPFYQAMDLLAMPSSKEGLSNVLLEAMACGVPCLAHPACGASEVIKDGVNGRLVPMETASDIAIGATLLLENSEFLEELGNSARNSAESDFSLETMVGEYSLLYEAVAR